MTPVETSKLMSVLRAAYPSYYRDVSDDDTRAALALWAEFLAPYPADVVNKAVRAIIASNKFAPTISELLEKIKPMQESLPPAKEWPITDWEIRSMINLRVNLEMPIPDEYVRLARERGIPLPKRMLPISTEK